jgi:hypothetical protein
VEGEGGEREWRERAVRGSGRRRAGLTHDIVYAEKVRRSTRYGARNRIVWRLGYTKRSWV